VSEQQETPAVTAQAGLASAQGTVIPEPETGQEEG
jgi:hypothetical protein